MYNHQKSSDRAPRHHREGLPGCALLPNFRSRVPRLFGASVTDPSGWPVPLRNRQEQLCSEQESSGLSFLQFSVSFEIRISSFLLLVNFTVRKLPERAQISKWKYYRPLSSWRSHLSALRGSIDSFTLSRSAIPFSA